MYVTKHKPNADVFYIFANNPPICDVAVFQGLYGKVHVTIDNKYRRRVRLMLGSLFYFLGFFFQKLLDHKFNILYSNRKLIKF